MPDTDSSDKHQLLFEKIWGSLAALAVGDALGYPAHEMPRELIIREFGGWITEFKDAPEINILHPSMKAGQITDDTIMSLVTARAIIESDGSLTASNMGRALAKWAQSTTIWETAPMFGPTTKATLRRLIAGEDPVAVGTDGYVSTVGVSNGSAMRIAPVGLIYPGRPDLAAKMAVEASLPTHGTTVAIACTCAVASAVAEAAGEGSDIFSIARAAVDGARIGEQEGLARARIVPAPDVADRICQAVDIGFRTKDVIEAGELLGKKLGCTFMAVESVPTAIGMFVASGGDVEKAMIGGANAGGDTDSIASIAGSIAGAFRGIKHVPADLYEEVESINKLGIKELASQLHKIAVRNFKANN